jgi:hypothetical protein
MKVFPTAAVMLAVALTACSKGQQAAEPDPPPPQTPAQKTVLDTQLKALQKAKDVQKTVDQQKADMDKKLEDQGG